MPEAAPHPLIQKLSEVYRVARASTQSADVHDAIREYANEVAGFIAQATAPKVTDPPVVIPGPGHVPAPSE